MMIKISVLMSVYCKDNPEHIDEALKSLQAQDKKAEEVVLVVDGPSTPAIDRVLESYIKNLNINFVRLEQNVGLGAALNAGLAKCRSSYIARMDSDDICTPDRFSKQSQFLQENPHIDVLGTGIVEFDENGNEYASRETPRGMENIKKFSRFRSPINHVTVIYKKESIQACGGYDSGLRLAQDYHLWCKMLSLGYQLENLETILVKVRAGKKMFKRRGGIRAIKNEFKLIKSLRKDGDFSKMNLLFLFLSRILMQLAPSILRSSLYSMFLRKRS